MWGAREPRVANSWGSQLGTAATRAHGQSLPMCINYNKQVSNELNIYFKPMFAPADSDLPFQLFSLAFRHGQSSLAHINIYIYIYMYIHTCI